MMRTMTMAAALAALALPAAGLVAAAPATAAMPVFDATNYAQNLLQASRALEQINQQLTSLQNEAAMIETMERNLKTIDFPQLGRIRSAMQRIDQLMGEARGIGFKVDELDRSFGTLFPDAARAARSDERVAGARARFDAAMDGFRHSLKVQARVVTTVREDAAMLEEIAGTSQSAAGALQAQQAANQLLALSAKQQLQIQDLLAAEFRSDALERARRAQEQAEAQAATRRFLGSGRAYSGTRE